MVNLEQRRFQGSSSNPNGDEQVAFVGQVSPDSQQLTPCNAATNQTKDEKEKPKELYQEVQDCLNNVKPHQLKLLVAKVRRLEIDSTEKLLGVLDLIFRKVANEPDFSTICALMCKELAVKQVSANATKKEGQEIANVRRLLISRCELEFKNMKQKWKVNKPLADLETKKQMRSRTKSVGTVRFFGDLFKQQLLGGDVILQLLHSLCETKNDESLECLCTLMMSVAKTLESRQFDLGSVWSTMKYVANRQDGGIDSRVMRMIQDVVGFVTTPSPSVAPQRREEDFGKQPKKKKRDVNQDSGILLNARMYRKWFGNSIGNESDFTTTSSSNYTHPIIPGKEPQYKSPIMQEDKNDLLLGQASTSGNDGHSHVPNKQDDKLHGTQIAWSPAPCNPGPNQTEDEKKTEELYENVQDIINKVNLRQTIISMKRARSLAIGRMDRLQGVIDLIFEKALEEPQFSVACAVFCWKLASVQNCPSGALHREWRLNNFRQLLATKCQLEFEKHWVARTEHNRKSAEMQECSDPALKDLMRLDLGVGNYRLRMKFIGYFKFLGELLNRRQQLIAADIVMQHLLTFLETKDKESLECFCAFLRTEGKVLEISKKIDLDAVFVAVKDVLSTNREEVNGGVRCMLQDVIDARVSYMESRKPCQNS